MSRIGAGLATAIAALAAAGNAAVHGQALARDYRFETAALPSLPPDATGKGPVLRPAAGSPGRGYRFGAGQGLHLSHTGTTDHYTLEITCQLDHVTGYRKIVDFKDRGSDLGLYAHNGRLCFYRHAEGARVEAGREHLIRVERDRETRRVRAFVDDTPAFEFTDTEGDAAFQEQRAHFFMDDRQTETEQTSGAVSRIRIWDAPGGK